ADEAEVEQKAADLEAEEVRPVPQCRDIRQCEVVVVESLVVALVEVEIELGEGLKDRLVDSIQEESDEDRQRVARYRQWHQEPEPEDGAEYQNVGCGCMVHSYRSRATSNSVGDQWSLFARARVVLMARRRVEDRKDQPQQKTVHCPQHCFGRG